MSNPNTSVSKVLIVAGVLFGTGALIWFLPFIFSFVGGLIEDLFEILIIAGLIYAVISWFSGK